MGMSIRRKALLLLLAAAGCSSDSTSPNGGGLTLSASQAAAVMTRIQQISVTAPELSWLADSANVVLRAGAELDSVPITTTRTSGQFYAVGLQRRIATANAYSTFTFIAFDNPDAPSNLILVNGYLSAGGATPPTAMAGSFGSSNNQQLSGYVFHIAGGTVTEWKSGGTGSASMASAASTGVCAQATNGATCTRAGLTTSFSIDAGKDTAGTVITPRTAAMSATTVAGIVLTFP